MKTLFWTLCAIAFALCAAISTPEESNDNN